MRPRKHRPPGAPWIVFVFAAAACAAASCAAPAALTASGGLLFPSDDAAAVRLTTYAGTVTGRDGEPLSGRLDLRPDSTFFLRLERMPEGPSSERKDEIGVWDLGAAGDTLLLYPTLGGPFRLALAPDGGLEIAALRGVRGRLARAEPGPPMEPSLFLRGRFSTVGGERIFYECATGWRLAVVDNPAAAWLDSLALTYRPNPEEEILASLWGRLVEREGSGRASPGLALVIERSGYVWPGETCGRWFALARLEDVVWRPLQIGGEPLAVPLDSAEPWLRLRSEWLRVEAFGGCNSIGGRYESEGERLQILSLHSTRRFCEGAMEREAAFAEALRRAASWSIRLGVLELFDEGGERLAHFEATYRP